MTLWHGVGLALALAVALYLVWALLAAEDFE
ncbi:MAG TPA: potassium-transporting ATPase subunit F [Burkholderiaceae bacterium]|nr:potassium-transporting ATPase subunit F [Burkholderiaceae bacterium]HQR70955.1 potassium-transporting ATPase subunit F [Burkholderiaceae bacterium]